MRTVPVGLSGVVTYADRDMVLLWDDSIIDHTGRLVGVLPPSVKGRLFERHTTVGRASAIPGLPPSLIF